MSNDVSQNKIRSESKKKNESDVMSSIWFYACMNVFNMKIGITCSKSLTVFRYIFS